MWSQVALGTITTNKASRGDGIPVELFQILKDDAVKALNSICQQIWRAQQWPQDWRRSVFIPIPKKGNAKECSNYRTNYCVTSFYLEYFHSSNQWVRQSTSPRWFFSESLIRHGLVLPISSLVFWVFHVFLIKKVHAQWIVGWRKASEIPSQRKLRRENT